MEIRSFIARLLSVLLCAGMAPAAELPVKTVVLYKHGVGYFERSGAIGPGDSARLDFNAADMNDVLKSLTINDQGGKVAGLRYDSSIGIGEKLGEFPFAIEPGQALSAILDQLKGARLELDFGGQKTVGAIVSARLMPGDKDHAEREQLTLLMDSGDMRNVDLGAASAIRFTDAKLQLQFKDYLGALTSSRSKEKRSVYVDSTDSKSREVKAAYIMPMPAWKSSYRLVFDAAGIAPVLEGWAIVDNTTGEDWTNVQMSLVSGKPISFISQLYAPKMINRQSAELAEDQAIAPTVYGGAVQNKVALAAPAAFAGAGGGGGGGRGGAFGGARDALAESPMAGLPAQRSRAEASSVMVAGSGTEIADLFEYAIKTPVTVKKNESAMLPFLQQKIAARKLIIYSDTSRPNPLSAAELTNDTGRTLDGGPVTVFDAGAYAGESLVETIKGGDKRFISYGVDLGTRISSNQKYRNDAVREIHVHNGILLSRISNVQSRVYTINNVDARAKTLIIEHPVRGEYGLIETAKPMETTRDMYRFEVKLAANATVEFPVTEERVYDQTIQISSQGPDWLLTYAKNTKLSEAARRQFQQLVDLKAQIATGDAERNRVTTEIDSVTRDEQRNRENIASLSNVSGQQQMVQEYARRLSEQETQILKLRDRQKELDQQKGQLQGQLNDLIAKLEF